MTAAVVNSNRRATSLLHEWSAKRHQQTTQQLERMRREKVMAETDECTFSPELATAQISTNEKKKASKMLQRRRQNGDPPPARRRPQNNSPNELSNTSGLHPAPPPSALKHSFSADNTGSAADERAAAAHAHAQHQQQKHARFADESPPLGPDSPSPSPPPLPAAPAQPQAAPQPLPAPAEAPAAPAPDPTAGAGQPAPQEAGPSAMPQQQAQANMEHVQRLLAQEKQAWVAKLKMENVSLMNVLADVRQAKKKLMSEREAMDVEKRQFMALGIERRESLLEQTLAKMPLAASGEEGDADGEELHSVISKLVFQLRANQQKVLSRVLDAATELEREHTSTQVPNVTRLRNSLDAIRDVVHYTNLDSYFDKQWGQPGNSEMLHRRVISMRPVDTPGAAGDADGPVPEDVKKQLSSLNSKNLALKNNLKNLKELRRREAQTKKSAPAAASPVAATATAAGGHSPRALPEPSAHMAAWTDIPPEWQRAAYKAVLEEARAQANNHGRRDGLDDGTVDEVADFVAQETTDVLAPLLSPIVALHVAMATKAAESGAPEPPFDQQDAAEKCRQIAASPAFAVEIEPLVVLALTYAQTRPGGTAGDDAAAGGGGGGGQAEAERASKPEVRFTDAGPAPAASGGVDKDADLSWVDRMSLY